nr:MAG TPA: hypothetical protein [Ackermannviridae sp.]
MSKKKLSEVEKNQQIYNDFVKTLEGKTNEELLALEQDLIKEIDKHDRKVAKYEFKVADKEALKEAVEVYRFFINKQKLQFSYVEGMLQLWDAFNPDIETIPYPTFDVILMNLGQLQFEGHDEWVKIMKFNEFTKPYSDEYTKLKARTYLLSEEHSALQSKLGLDDAAASNNK